MAPDLPTHQQADLLAGVLDSSLDGIMAFSSVRDEQSSVCDFEIGYVNKVAEQIVGRTRQQLIGHTMLEVFPGNKEDGLFDAYARVVETGEPFLTEHHYAHDGLDHWFSIKAAKCADGFTVTFADITAQKQAQVNLKTANERFELLVAGNSSGVWDWDCQTDAVYYSPRFNEMLGYGPNGMESTLEAFVSRLHPEDRDRVWAQVQAHTAKENPYDVEYRLQHKDGHYVWCHAAGQAQWDEQGNPIRMAGSITDISHRKASEERFRVLFEHSTNAHLLYTTDDEGIIACNQAAVDMLGYDSKEELLGVHPAKMSPDYQPCGLTSEERKNRLEAVVQEQGYARFDWMHLRKDGSEILVEVTLKPVTVDGREVTLIVWHDITPRLENERKAEQAIERLNEAQALANIGSWQWTPADNVIIWSDQTKRMFGVPVDQPAPDFQAHLDQIHPDDQSYWLSVVDKAMQDHEPYTMRFRTVLPDGTTRIIEGKGQAEVDEQGEVVRMYGTTQDLTESEAIRDELKKLSMVASRTEDGVIVTDAEGRVEWVNRAFSKITGYKIDEVRGKKPGHVLQGPDTDAQTVKRIRKSLSVGHGFRETLLNYRKNGEAFWNEVEVQPIRDEQKRIVNYMAIERDVTAERQQQAELDDQRQRLEFALQASQAGLWDWDVRTGNNFLSDTWYTMVGYEPGELPMHISSWHAITMPEDLDRAQEALADYFAGKTPRYACEMRIKNKAGNWQWILDVGEAVERDDKGNVTRMVGLHLDIDAQKRAQIELEEARDQARLASAAKSEFVANMSHEIRTPMNAILGYADLLLDVGQSEADKRNHAQTIRRNGKHLLSILNDILDLSKIEAGKMAIEQITCSPDEIMEDVVSLMSTKADAKGITLKLDAQGDIPRNIKSDPTRLRQVLLNLVGNAIKFTETGGVTLAARYEAQGPDHGRFVCDVIDTGIGISQQQLETLFQPFSQADESTTRKFGGTGLGLTISNNLCQMLGGSLSCTSTPGQGSTFTAAFTVGTSKQQAMASAKPSPIVAETNAPLKDKRILIVEDGPDNQRLFKHFVSKAGGEVELMENGQLGFDAAIGALEEGKPFDVILMDMQMPVLDGYAATAKLRDHGYDLPIIALTAHASAEDRHKCLLVGCTDYMSKPVDRKKLIQLLTDYTSPANIGEGI